MVSIQPVNSVINATEGEVVTYQVQLIGSIERNVQFTVQTVNTDNLVTSGKFKCG